MTSQYQGLFPADRRERRKEPGHEVASSYGRNSEFDSSEFAVRYTDDHSEDFVSDQETEERLDVDETDIV